MAAFRALPQLMLMCGLLLCFAGCGGGGAEGLKREQKDSELLAIHEMYMYFVKATEQAPKQPADLKKYENLLPHGMRALQENRYVVVWGVKDKSSSILLAYEKDGVKQGGTVVMSDGTIKAMTAAELQAAAKK